MMEIKIETRFNAEMIEQSTKFDGCQLDNPINKITKDIMDLKDQGIIDALIALGWTPPKGVTGSKDEGKDAVFMRNLEQASDAFGDEHERDAYGNPPGYKPSFIANAIVEVTKRIIKDDKND